MSDEIAGRRIAFLATDGVEQVELDEPWRAVTEAGGTAVLIAPEAGEIQAYNHLDEGDRRTAGLGLDDARAEMDDSRRATLYQDAQRLIVEDSADMTPMFGDRLVGIGRDVVNYREYGFEFDYLQIGLRA